MLKFEMGFILQYTTNVRYKKYEGCYGILKHFTDDTFEFHFEDGLGKRYVMKSKCKHMISNADVTTINIVTSNSEYRFVR